jgi:hypothetical protein
MRGEYDDGIDISTSHIVHKILVAELYSFFVKLFLQATLCTGSVDLKSMVLIPSLLTVVLAF